MMDVPKSQCWLPNKISWLGQKHEPSRLIGQLLPTLPTSIIKRKKISDSCYCKEAASEFINTDFHVASQVYFLTEHQRRFILLTVHTGKCNEMPHRVNFIQVFLAFCLSPACCLHSVLGCVCHCYWGSLSFTCFKEQLMQLWQLSVAFCGILSVTDCGSIEGTVLEQDKASLVHFHLVLFFYLDLWLASY